MSQSSSLPLLKSNNNFKLKNRKKDGRQVGRRVEKPSQPDPHCPKEKEFLHQSEVWCFEEFIGVTSCWDCHSRIPRQVPARWCEVALERWLTKVWQSSWPFPQIIEGGEQFQREENSTATHSPTDMCRDCRNSYKERRPLGEVIRGERWGGRVFLRINGVFPLKVASIVENEHSAVCYISAILILQSYQ